MFDEMMSSEHNVTYYGMHADTVEEDVSEVRDLLDFTIIRFMMTSQTYVIVYLRAYCDMASRILKKDEIDDYAALEIREMIGFPDELEHCMVTAFYDTGESMLDVGFLFESTFFLQAIGRDRALTVGDLKFQLKRSRQRLGLLQKLFKLDYLPSRGIYVFEDLMSKLNEYKGAITDFSNAFCVRWTPSVSRLFIAKPESDDDDRIENLFVDHAFHCEICAITKSQEYRYQEYEEDVMAPFDIEQKEINEIEVYGDPIPSSYFSLLSYVVSEEYEREVKYSLATLKHDLQWNSFYLNAVKYYNIAADVMLLVSIKEERKIFKWIKFVVLRNCTNDGNEKTADEMRGLRSTLSAFTAVFDKIVTAILDKKRINVTRNRRKKTFDQQVNALVTLLDVRDYRMTDQMQRICEVIPNEIRNGVDYDAHPGVNPIKAVKFEEYYGTDPILNISQLYHYVVNDF